MGNLELGSDSYKRAAEAYERATGAPPAELRAWAPPGLTAPMDHYNAAAIAAHRAEHSHPCAVPWCGRPAAWSWQRTPAELRDIYRGKRWADTRESWERTREVCDVHRPHWRANVYVQIGQTRQLEAPAAAKRPARKVAPAAAPSPGPALAAALDELADTRAELGKVRAELQDSRTRHAEELAAVRAQLEQYSETWAMLAARSEELRQARAELAMLRQDAPAPADMLAELVA